MPESRKNPPESKEPFVSKEDRPEVQISLDTPLSELRVRDLSSILVSMGGKHPLEGKTPSKTLSDEVGKPHLKDAKIEKYEKNEFKDKLEGKDKLEKIEKYEKNEKWETKNEKLEVEAGFDPGRTPIPDPRLEKLIETVTGLTKQVSQLANQLEELRKKD